MYHEKLSLSLVENCCDFVRLTMDKTCKSYPEWRNLWDVYEMDGKSSGCDSVEVRMRGYQLAGYDGVIHGDREGHAIFQASGPVAHHIMEDGKDLPHYGKATRTDTKVSITPHEGYALPLPRDYAEAAWKAERDDGRRTRALNLIETVKGGDTVYLGSKDAPSFVRVYQADKRHPERYSPGTLSFEVQHNRKESNIVFNSMRSSANMNICAASIVIGKLMSIGLDEPWFRGLPSMKPPTIVHQSSKDGILKWLPQSVFPSFHKANREEWEGEYLDALGLNKITLEMLLRIRNHIDAVIEERRKDANGNRRFEF